GLQAFVCTTRRNHQFSQSGRPKYEYAGVNVGEHNDTSAAGYHQVGYEHCRSTKYSNKPACFSSCPPRRQHYGHEIKNRDVEVGSVINPANQHDQQNGPDYCYLGGGEEIYPDAMRFVSGGKLLARIVGW